MKNICLALSLALVLAACFGDRAPLVATDVSIDRPKVGRPISAGYLTLVNNTSEPISISSVSSPQFDSIEIHESVVEGGITRMFEVPAVTIAPKSEVVFAPGGKHLMMIRPVADAESVTLDFHSGQEVVLSITVEFSD